VFDLEDDRHTCIRMHPSYCIDNYSSIAYQSPSVYDLFPMLSLRPCAETMQTPLPASSFDSFKFTTKVYSADPEQSRVLLLHHD
jgi:hypothetical protein